MFPEDLVPLVSGFLPLCDFVAFAATCTAVYRYRKRSRSALVRSLLNDPPSAALNAAIRAGDPAVVLAVLKAVGSLVDFNRRRCMTCAKNGNAHGRHSLSLSTTPPRTGTHVSSETASGFNRHKWNPVGCNTFVGYTLVYHTQCTPARSVDETLSILRHLFNFGADPVFFPTDGSPRMHSWRFELLIDVAPLSPELLEFLHAQAIQRSSSFVISYSESSWKLAVRHSDESLAFLITSIDQRSSLKIDEALEEAASLGKRDVIWKLMNIDPLIDREILNMWLGSALRGAIAGTDLKTVKNLFRAGHFDALEVVSAWEMGSRCNREGDTLWSPGNYENATAVCEYLQAACSGRIPRLVLVHALTTQWVKQEDSLRLVTHLLKICKEWDLESAFLLQQPEESSVVIPNVARTALYARPWRLRDALFVAFLTFPAHHQTPSFIDRLTLLGFRPDVTHFELACASGHVSTVEHMLKLHSDGLTDIHFDKLSLLPAAESPAVLEVLIRSRGGEQQLLSEVPAGREILQHAVQQSSVRAISYLLKLGLPTTGSVSSLLESMHRPYASEILSLLHQAGANVRQEFADTFRISSPPAPSLRAYSDPKVLHTLLDGGVDVFPLWLVRSIVATDDPDLFARCLRSGMDVRDLRADDSGQLLNARNPPPRNKIVGGRRSFVHYVAAEGRAEILKVLMSGAIRPAPTSKKDLALAMLFAKDARTAQVLVDAGVQVDCSDSDVERRIRALVSGGRAEMVRVAMACASVPIKSGTSMVQGLIGMNHFPERLPTAKALIEGSNVDLGHCKMVAETRKDRPILFMLNICERDNTTFT
ncbi:hypothetical protein BJ742DRAFT_776468 [Cladochytrium replicatum]|nr:hypothetical protein BJ742DRAFT_776468 [Cladochytrium replicatum]